MRYKLIDNINYDPKTGELSNFFRNQKTVYEKRKVALKGSERILFEILVNHHGEPVTYDEFFDLMGIGKFNARPRQAITDKVHAIRLIMDTICPEHELIQTVRGIGYSVLFDCECDDNGNPIKIERVSADNNIKITKIRCGQPGENGAFTGRTAELDELEKNYSSGCRIQILNGMGGMGKTQLAVKYAYLHEDEYDIIHWVDGHSLSTIIDSYDFFLRQYAPGLPRQNDKMVLQSYRDFMSNHKAWLIIYDNCDFYTYKKEDVKAFKNDCIPTGGGHILITSRDLDEVGVSRCIKVDVFEPPEAVEFIVARSGDSDRCAAEELTTRLGCFPLALEMAGAYIKATACGIKKYLDLLSKDISILDNTYTDKYENTLSEIITITLEYIEQNEKDKLLTSSLKQLIYTSACSFPDRINLEAYGYWEGVSEEEADQFIIDDLCNYCKEEKSRIKLAAKAVQYALLKRNGEYLSIHPLIQEIIRKDFNSEQFQLYLNDVASVYTYYLNRDCMPEFDAENEKVNIIHCYRLWIENFSGINNELERYSEILIYMIRQDNCFKETEEYVNQVLDIINKKFSPKNESFDNLYYLASIHLTVMQSYFPYILDREKHRLLRKRLNKIIDAFVDRIQQTDINAFELGDFLNILSRALFRVLEDESLLSDSVRILNYGLKVIDRFVKMNGADAYVLGIDLEGRVKQKTINGVLDLSLHHFTMCLLEHCCYFLRNDLYHPEFVEYFESLEKLFNCCVKVINDDEAYLILNKSLTILNAYKKQNKELAEPYVSDPSKMSILGFAGGDMLKILDKYGSSWGLR